MMMYMSVTYKMAAKNRYVEMQYLTQMSEKKKRKKKNKPTVPLSADLQYDKLTHAEHR